MGLRAVKNSRQLILYLITHFEHVCEPVGCDSLFYKQALISGSRAMTGLQHTVQIKLNIKINDFGCLS